MVDSGRLEDAIAFAAHHHKGQRDKCGQPYIMHPLRVMMRLDDEDARIAAVLHDVIEDCGVEPVYIRMGYGDVVGDAVEALTRAEDEPYADYIERCGANEIARRVKWADLRDNIDPVRLAAIPEPTRSRLIAKYRTALDRINAIAAAARRGET
jgi:(p)ppGpp synthase/HD superfamily hydrolase